MALHAMGKPVTMLVPAGKIIKNRCPRLPWLPGSRAGSLSMSGRPRTTVKSFLRVCSHRCKTSQAGSRVLMLKD